MLRRQMAIIRTIIKKIAISLISVEELEPRTNWIVPH
jgi:hypothetical protein